MTIQLTTQSELASQQTKCMINNSIGPYILSTKPDIHLLQWE